MAKVTMVVCDVCGSPAAPATYRVVEVRMPDSRRSPLRGDVCHTCLEGSKLNDLPKVRALKKPTQ